MKINKMGKIYINEDDTLVFQGWDIDGEDKPPEATQLEVCNMMLDYYIKALREKMEEFGEQPVLFFDPVEQEMLTQWRKI